LIIFTSNRQLFAGIKVDFSADFAIIRSNN
jgi:hypothetical protein